MRLALVGQHLNDAEMGERESPWGDDRRSTES